MLDSTKPFQILLTYFEEDFNLKKQKGSAGRLVNKGEFICGFVMVSISNRICVWGLVL